MLLAERKSINILFDYLDNVQTDIGSYAQFLGEAYFVRAWFYYDLYKDYGDLPIYDHQLFPGNEALLDPRSPRTDVSDFILSELNIAFQYLGTRQQVGNSRINKETALAFKAQVALYEGSWQKYHVGTEFGTNGADPTKNFQQVISASEELMNGNFTVGLLNTGKPEVRLRLCNRRCAYAIRNDAE